MNLTTYPYFTAMLRDLGVDTEPSNMTFALSVDDGRLEWGSNGPSSLFAQKSNLVSPRFWRMTKDILRFADECLEVLESSWVDQVGRA